VSLKAGTELTECVKLLYGEITRTGEKRVVNRSEVTSGKDENILALSVTCPILGVMVHDLEIKRCQEIS
jgi:hypothetical protein